MTDIEMEEKQRLRRKIYELATEVGVNKDLKWNAICERDEKTGVIICVGKKYVSDSTHSISGYAKIGGTRIVAVGDANDIKKLEETIGP